MLAPRAAGLDRFCKPSMLACGRRPVKQAPAARVGKGEFRVALVASARGDEVKPATLDQLTALLRSDLDRVNTLILERMQSPVALIP